MMPHIWVPNRDIIRPPLFPGRKQIERYACMPVASQNAVIGQKPVSGPVAGSLLWTRSDFGTFQSNAGTTAASSDTDVVGYWTDQSGNGNHLKSNANDTARPILKLSQVNGFPSIRFDGSNDILKALFTLSLPLTVFIVVNQISWVSGTTLVAGGVADNMSFVQSGSSPNFKVSWLGSGTGGTNDGNLAVGTWGIVEINLSAATKYVKVGSNAQTNQTVADAGAKGGVSISAHPNPSNYCNAEFAEVLVYNTALNGTDATANRTYLATRYGL